MVIRILDHVRAASTYEDGDVIYRLIVKSLRDGGTVRVSFEGITSVPSAFVNAAFVRLLESFTFQVVRERLKIEDSTRQINELVRSRFAFVAGGGPQEFTCKACGHRGPAADGIEQSERRIYVRCSNCKSRHSLLRYGGGHGDPVTFQVGPLIGDEGA